MPRADPGLTCFNGGELSPSLIGRPDVDKYAKGCQKLENMIPRVSGIAAYRPGSQYVATAKDLTARYIFAFEANSGSNTMVEMGTNYFRYYDGATRQPIVINGSTWQPSSNGGFDFTRAETATTFTAAVEPSRAQQNDVMWITNGLTLPKKLQRIAAYQFQIAGMGDGIHAPYPMNDVNPLQAITVTPSAVSGAISLVASAALFANKNIGEFWYQEGPLTSSISHWETGKTISAAGTFTTFNGRAYRSLNAGGVTGTSPPTHSQGAQWDGQATTSVQWQLTDEGFGVYLITAVADSTHASATVLKQLPITLNGASSNRWARQAWNVDDGYPTSVCFFNQRLCWARNAQFWASQVGDFENYEILDAGLPTDETAISISIAVNRNSRMRWLSIAPTSSDLIAGTSDGPFAIGPQTEQLPFSASNIRARLISDAACEGVQPLRMSQSLIYVQRGGRRLRELYASPDIATGYATDDLMIYADHIPAQPKAFTGVPNAGQITSLARTKSPDPIIWASGYAVEGNRFYGLTLERAQQVAAWARHYLGGDGDGGGVPPSVVDMEGLQSPNQRDDDLWLLTRRWGSTYSLEVIGAVRGSIQQTTYWSYDQLPSVTEANYLDYSTSAFTTSNSVSGLGRMPDGTAVQMLIDGYVTPDSTVISGSAVVRKGSLSRVARVGFGYLGILHPMPPRGSSAAGVPEGKRSRIWSCMARLVASVGGKVGYEENPATADRIVMRSSGDAMGRAIEQRSGDFSVLLRDGWHGGRADDTRCEVVFMQDQPLPSFVAGLYPKLKVSP